MTPPTMKGTLKRLKSMAAPAAFILAFACCPLSAEEIVVSNYGVSANGMPYAVALEKGFFREEGANVTGILTSAAPPCATCSRATHPMPRSIPMP
jgi:NitT/TauT family transport system substrate-binding protein